MPLKKIMTNFDMYLLKQSSTKQDADKKSIHFSFYINQGLDLQKLESRYTTTLFVMAQVHSKLNNVEEGMQYCGETMKRQLSTSEY